MALRWCAAGLVEAGKQFRLRNKGMPVLRSTQTGDMYIQVSVETPDGLHSQTRSPSSWQGLVQPVTSATAAAMARRRCIEGGEDLPDAPGRQGRPPPPA